jgi:hypothetical protein
MSKSFQIIPAKPTFGSLKSQLYSSDYINKKKNNTIFCKKINNKYIKNNTYLQQGQYISLKYLIKNKYFCCPNGNNLINKTNLNYNLITKEDLKDVNVLESVYGVTPTNIDSNINFNENYIIDYKGELFGSTQCGLNNYINYMVPYCSN